MAHKWNWGKSIVAMIVFFMAIWAGLVFFAFNQKVDLVAPNYYEKELQYQQEIDKQHNTMALAGKIKITQSESTIAITFPVLETGSAIAGNVTFYRPSDSGRDKTIPILTDSTGTMHIGLKGFTPGFYKVKIQWNTPVQKYFNEESIRI